MIIEFKLVMKNLLSNIIFAFFIVSSTSIFSQPGPIEYHYDRSGNRVEKNVVLLRMKSDGSEGTNTKSHKELGDYLISVFPNPTKGAIEIEVENFDPQFDASLSIFSQSGKLILTKEELNPSNLFDLTDNSAGVYFLTIHSKEESNTWKIIKQ